LSPDLKMEALSLATELALVQMGGQTWTLYQFPSVEDAKKSAGELKFAGRNFSLHHAYWTTGM
jgi:hypothetical protein